MILADRLISRSCRTLASMIGVRLPGGGAYRSAGDGDGARACSSRPPASFLPHPFPSRFHLVAAHALLRRLFVVRQHEEAP